MPTPRKKQHKRPLFMFVQFVRYEEQLGNICITGFISGSGMYRGDY